MKQYKEIELDFEVDKLTNSIENAVSGEVFDTLITLLKITDSKHIKKSEWAFNWHTEIKDKSKQVFKLTTANNPTIIHGLISLKDKGDHIFMYLIESAKFNKGKNKLYKGVAGNLIAFSCKISFGQGYEGLVSLLLRHNLFNIINRH